MKSAVSIRVFPRVRILDMIASTGIDLVNLDRMQRSLSRSGEAFAARVFTDDERTRARADARPLLHFASLFAAKEACFKAIGLPFDAGFDWKDLDVDPGPRLTRPSVRCTGPIAEHVGRRRLLLSLAAGRSQVIALAVLLSDSFSSGGGVLSMRLEC